MMETLGGSDKFDKAINAMQGAEQLREMESMTAKDQKRAEMEQRGLSEEQIAAYLGEGAPRSGSPFFFCSCGDAGSPRGYALPPPPPHPGVVLSSSLPTRHV